MTHPKVHAPPTPLASAIDKVEAWLEAPTLVLLSESGDYWRELRTTIEAGRVVGPQVHDARIAALCLQHGVRGLWSADRDFGRFQNHDPLVRGGHRLIAESACTDAEALTRLAHYDFCPVGLVMSLRVVFPPCNLRFLGQFSVR